MPREKHLDRVLLTLKAATLEYAKDMIGVKEDYVKGKWTNWGPKIKEFLFAANVKEPAPWCAAFVNWCAEQGSYDTGLETPLEKVKIQAYVQSYADWAKAEDRFVPASDAQQGDLFILYYPELSRYAHIGFVTEANDNEGWFTTIEGNTNDEASREGFKVSTRRRSISERVKFIRWA